MGFRKACSMIEWSSLPGFALEWERFCPVYRRYRRTFDRHKRLAAKNRGR